MSSQTKRAPRNFSNEPAYSEIKAVAGGSILCVPGGEVDGDIYRCKRCGQQVVWISHDWHHPHNLPNTTLCEDRAPDGLRHIAEMCDDLRAKGKLPVRTFFENFQPERLSELEI